MVAEEGTVVLVLAVFNEISEDEGTRLPALRMLVDEDEDPSPVQVEDRTDMGGRVGLEDGDILEPEL